MTGRAAPFDAAAAGYDAEFARQPVGRLLRQAVQREVEPLVRDGDRVLDLGCGSGEDALWLAARGARVVAVDRSGAMLSTAAAKVAAADLAERVRLARLDLAELDPDRDELGALAGGEPFELALADMGPLNCLADRRPLAESLWRALAPGGRFVAVVMGPVCAWEIGWHLLHGEPRRAFRRLRRDPLAAPTAKVSASGDAEPIATAEIPVSYPSARRLRRELAPWFRAVRRTGIGLFVPPPYLAHLIERRPRRAALAATLDRALAALPPLPGLADHYLVVFERRDRPLPAAERPPATDPLAAPTTAPLRRRLWRRLLRMRFRLSGNRRHGRAVREELDGRPLEVAAGVFNPVLFRTAPVLAAAIRAAAIPDGARVLDLGTGSGAGALLALTAIPRAEAVASDVDPRAARCAAGNAERWGLARRLATRTGDLFAPVAGERFDVVLFHPPFWRTTAAPDPTLAGYERAFYADADLPERFAAGLARHLRPDGFALLLLSSAGEESAFLSACRAAGHALAPLLRRDLGGEMMSAYRIRPRGEGAGSGDPA